MLPEQLADVVATAASFAARTGAESTDLYHLLLALADVSEAQRWLRERGASHGDLRDAIFEKLDARSPVEARKNPMTLSPLVIVVLERAFARDSGCSPSAVLDAVCGVEFDTQTDFGAAEALRALIPAEAFAPPAEPAAQPRQAQRAPEAVSPAASQSKSRERPSGVPEALARFCRDLVEDARQGRLDSVFGREKEIARVEEILCRRRKGNPVLVGEAGVGKTAVVEGLAARIADGSAAKALAGTRIMSLDVTGLVSGTRNRGDFEERIDGIVKALEADRSLVLFVDEIHMLVGGSSGAAEAANLLKPPLASGRIRCIGATTHGEYARHFDSDPAMARRFQQVKIDEPTRLEAIAILGRSMPAYETHHGLSYDAAAVEAAVDLTTRYVLGRQLPDKALDVLDEAGALAAARGTDSVSVDVVREIVARMTGVSVSQGFGAIDLPLVGQEKARAAIRKAHARREAGVGRRAGARLSFLFVGPDGSGKGFAAERLADETGATLIRFSMSAFREPHSVSRLIGSPPGYVGHGSGGQLTEAARRNPASVMVFDRVDLAHADVLEVLAAAASKGVLTDAAGRTVSFAGVTLVFTCPPDRERSAAIGFGARHEESQEDAPSSLGAIAGAVDCVVPFQKLGSVALETLARDRIGELVSGLRDKGVEVTVSDDVAIVVARSAEGGGGSGLERAFRNMVEDPVVDCAYQASALRLSADRDSVRVERTGQ